MEASVLNDQQVLSEVRRLVSIAQVSWGHHAVVRMAERGLSKGEIKECLLKGYFIERPHVPNQSEMQYKFTMFATVEGLDLTVVASLYPNTKVVVITAY